jgi:hypothetical protein
MMTHLFAVSIGIISKPPVLQGAAPMVAVVMAIFEFMFYMVCYSQRGGILVSWLAENETPVGPGEGGLTPAPADRAAP